MIGEKYAGGAGHLTVLTGAGVSAESGLPTFRGREGYWTAGSVNYHPQEMATRAMFGVQPDEVWKWYLYRLGVYRDAKPNAGHLALVEMEGRLQDRFSLITQNIDNLHLAAGNSPGRILQIHGNIQYMRCSRSCSGKLSPIPPDLLPREKRQPLTAGERERLTCPDCGGRMRPHVLWFDETYDERHYRFESALAIAGKTRVLVIAGTSGSTTLPNLVADTVHANGGTLIDINLETSPFTRLALNSPGGRFINKRCSEGLREILDQMDGTGISL